MWHHDMPITPGSRSSSKRAFTVAVRHHAVAVYRVCVMARDVAGPTVGGVMGNGMGRTDR